jgi:NADH dehydrogenase FAD-containing subunit
MSVEPEKRILLVGAGQAHLLVVSRARALIRAGAKVTLLSPEAYWYYPAMAAEVLSGYYGVKDFRVDLRALAEKHGVEFIQDEAVEILPGQYRVRTASGLSLVYDRASFAVGSVPVERERDVPVDGSFPLYPALNIIEIRNEVETLLELEPEKELLAAVLGGGAAGVEVALNLAALLKERAPQAGWRIVLLEAKGRVLSAYPAAASRRALKKLRLGVTVRTQAQIQHVQSGRVVLEEGETMDFDLAVVATGVRSPELFERGGLFTDDGGSLLVERTLRSREHPELFAAGDCARIMGLGLTRLGLHAAAQGPVLFHNLLAALQGGRLKTYAPARSPLQIISLGPKDALLLKGSAALQGSWALWLKHWLDRRYLRQYQVRSSLRRPSTTSANRVP